MDEKSQMTTDERRRQKIAKLKAQLQREEARLNKAARKERDGQLIAFGVLIEEVFKAGDEAQRQRLVASAKKHLTDRNLARALAGFERLLASASAPLSSGGDAAVS